MLTLDISSNRDEGVWAKEEQECIPQNGEDEDKERSKDNDYSFLLSKRIP